MNPWLKFLENTTHSIFTRYYEFVKESLMFRWVIFTYKNKPMAEIRGKISLIPYSPANMSFMEIPSCLDEL